MKTLRLGILAISASLFITASAPALDLQVLYGFQGAPAPSAPWAALLLGPDGNFYGTTYDGGSNDVGTIFKVTTNGVLTLLVSFNAANGAYPSASLVLGPDGTFYGTTAYGGSSDAGTVFRVTTNGILTSLASFNTIDGADPSGLVLGNDGNFYGTTADGGSSGEGTVFKVTTKGVLTSLVSFNGTNGAYPSASLVLGNDGNFYGTTGWGSDGSGTVFKVSTTGVLTTLASFNQTTGQDPSAPLVLGPDGNFYGTTAYGGSDDSGTVFKVTTNGMLTPLVSFSPAMGQNTSGAGLVFGRDGNLYGTSDAGGSYGHGTVFQVSTNGGLTTLISFNRTNGSGPDAGLTLGPDGNFYGTTYGGGPGGRGTVFRLIETYGRPDFSIQPYSRTNDAGTTATFSVLAIGSEPLSYQWCKAGVPLMDGGSLAGARTAVLLLTNVLSSDAGGYSVVLSNGFGNVTSVVARLTVLDPAIAVQPVSENRDVGQSVTFSVTAAGTIPLGYQWWRDGLALPQGTNSSLLLTNLQASDSGQYRVVVSNHYGSVTSVGAQLSFEKSVTVDPGFNPGAGGPWPSIGSLAVQADGKILVGGWFTMLGGQACTNIGRLSADGTLDSAFNPRANSSVYSLAVQADGKILVGGAFTTLGGQACTNIGRLNADGSLDSGFNPGADNYVYSLAVQADGKILVSGGFTTLGGQARYGIGRLNGDGTLDSAFNPGGANGSVSTLAVQADGKILVSGGFTTLGGQARYRIGRLNGDGTLDSAFNPVADNNVSSLVVQADGKIVVSGSFTMLGGQTHNRIGRLNADGTLDSEFNPGASSDVISLALQADGKILLGGFFSTLGGQACTNIGRLNADGTLDSGFNPGADSYVSSLAVQADGKILVCGGFTTLGGQARNWIGRLNNTAPATQSLSCDGSTITWLRGSTTPEVWRTTFDYSSNGLTWTDLGAGARILGGWRLTGLSLPPNATLRGRGYVAGSDNASGWFVESNTQVVQLHPVILVNDSSFGFHTNRFGFNLGAMPGQVVVIDISTNLANWLPLATNLVTTSPFYFSDPNSTNFAGRFYRARLQ